MLYSSLTDKELERWVRASPQDHAAKAEVLRRGLGPRIDRIEALEKENEELQDQKESLQSQLDDYEQV